MIDLHIHTTASADGQYPPEKIVEMASALGLSAIAFADHNTIASLETGRALCKKAGIDFLEAVELNTDHYGSDLHLLGYGVDPNDELFLKWLEQINEGLYEKARIWAANLVSLGLKLTFEEVMERSGGQIPTGSVFMQVLSGYPENLSHPLVKPYLPGGDKDDNPYAYFYFEVLADGPAKADVQVLTTVEAVRRLLEFRAVPVLGHPTSVSNAVLDALVENGLMGIEAHSSYHDEKKTTHYLSYARNQGLLITAGSDYHGEKIKPIVKLGGVSGNHRSVYETLLSAVKSRQSLPIER